MSHLEPDNRFRRAQRPIIGWLWVATGIGSAIFLILLLTIVLRGLNRWANGEPIDLMGIAAVAGVALPFLAQLIAQGIQWQRSRESERVASINASGVAPPPFASSVPPEGGPRPGDSP